MKKAALIIALAVSVCCTNPSDDFIRTAVRNHLALYPAAHLQDLYKAFFQAEFGPEHIISDTLSAGKYLDRELQIPDSSKVYCEPLGTDSSYFRVHLSAVQRGLLTRDELFDAFVRGSRKIEPQDIVEWKDKWDEIVLTIESMNLSLPDFESDKMAIDSLLNSGNYAFHHSQAFRDNYAPHYRIVRKDIFYDVLMNDKLAGTSLINVGED